MAEIVLKDVGKTYPGGVAAVKSVSLKIADGSFVVLVGPSGCGKSTTLRMVAGLEDISSGTVSIGGRVVNDVHPKDRDIAMVFQNYALYPHMSVYKNMAFALKMRRVPRDEIDRRVRGTAESLGITELLDRKPAALSGGQRQRVAVGRAIVREPKAFLFDEPLSNLDAKLRVGTRAELKSLHQRLKTTTLYVTHDQEEAMTLGDRIVVMSKGVVQQDGPPLEVYRSPANRFVAGFVGTPPMNFLEGLLQFREGRAVFLPDGASAAGGGVELPAGLSASVRERAGNQQRVVLGVRPQVLEPASPESAHDRPLAFAGRIDVIEPLGDQMDVVFTTPAGSRLVARVSASPDLGVGQTVKFVANAGRGGVHLFEPGEFGKNLMRSS